MKNGEHAASGGMKRSLVLVVSLLALVLVVAGGTLAWLTARDSVSNSFTPAHVSCTVEETFKGTAKSNVKIKNTSDVPAYIRAYIVVTWKDAQGNVYGQLPVEGTDYIMEISNNGWLEDRAGYYYYTSPVAAKGSTDNTTGTLIESCEVKGKAPAGCNLSVEIIAEAIQSLPARAVQDAWGVTINKGTVTAVSTAGN